MNLNEYVGLDAVGLAETISRGEVSRLEVVETAIEAIETLNPELNAVVMKNYANARKVAKGQSSDTPLSGVPYLLKDVNVFSHDMPTTFSCRFFKDAKPRADSEIVKRWRSAGLIVMGKANTPEFAEDYVCEPVFRGVTFNPWDKSMTTGGSSGGAGAAVASGMVPVAHGTDLGGSIRIPAACCGVYGLKPTTGLCPVDSFQQELASGFNSDHVLSRSVRDSAAVLDASAHPILGSRYPIRRGVSSYLQCLDDPLPGLTIGVCTNTPEGHPTPERHQAAVKLASDVLSDAGHELIDYQFPQDLDLGEWMGTLWMFDVVFELNRRIAEIGREPEREDLGAMTWYIRDLISSMSAMDHYHARQNAHQNSVKLMNSMANLDLLLTPSLGSDPVGVGEFDSQSINFDYEKWSTQGDAFAPFATICNMTGQPSASLPIMLAEDKPPCAVQLSGHSGQDHVVLQVSALLEKHFNWQSYRPPIRVDQ